MRSFILVIAITILFMGCSPGANEKSKQKSDDFADRVHDKTNDRTQQENYDPIKYIQSDEKGIAKDGTKHNIFETDEARAIAQELSARKDVKQTQVATNDEQVAVFVLLHDYQDPDIAKSLEKDIHKISPNKEIFVYTDKVHWNRLKDLDSTIKARQIGDNLEQFLEKYFNLDIKD